MPTRMASRISRSPRYSSLPPTRQTEKPPEKTMAANTMPSSTSKPRLTPLRLLYIGTSVLILLLLTMNAALLLNLREDELLDEEDRLSTISLILAEQANRSFQSADLVIRSIADGIAAKGVTDAASFDRIMAGQDIHLLLQT